MKQVITKKDYLTVGKIVNYLGDLGLEINGSTRFNVRVNAGKLIDTPYTKTKCVFFHAVEEDNSDPNISRHIRTLVGSGENITIEADGFIIEPDEIRIEPYSVGNLVYSLTPIETKDGNRTKTEYCLVPGKEYMLEIVVARSAYENEDGGVTYSQGYLFYFSDRIYDREKEKFVKGSK